MNKKILAITFAAAALFGFSSCEDYFDDVPDNATSLEDVFTNRGQSLSWLTNVYHYIPDWSNRYAGTGGGDVSFYIGAATSEGYLPWDWVPALDIIHGTLYPSTGLVSNIWTNYYRAIQYANVYLANIDNNPNMDSTEKEWTKAECRSLRALFYFELMKFYGPVPVVGDRVYSVDDPLTNMQLPRETVDSCFNYIIGELNTALNGGHLVSQFTNGAYEAQMKGNLTKEAVEGLLAEVYLFRASYLFNGDPYYQGLANQDGTKLFPQQRDEQKWRDARDAAKRIIDSGAFKLALRDANGKLVSSVDKSCPFRSVFAASMGSSDNEELIYGRTNSSNETYCMVPRFQGLGSNYDKGGGAFSVPLEFVDLYFTNKGLDITKDPDYFTYDTNDPKYYPVRNKLSITQSKACIDSLTSYQYFSAASGHSVLKQFYGREPRFYLAVTFQNRPWDFDKSTPVEMNYNGNSGPNGNTHDYPIFGTIVRKNYYAKESNVDMLPLLRLGEIYLNYAEACAELGELGEAMHYVNLIRQRAGVREYVGLNAEDRTPTDVWGKPRIDLGNLTQELVLKVVYRERLLELAYENKHYFDVRRWGVGEGKWRDGSEMTDGWIYPAYHHGGEGGDFTGFNVMNTGVTDENQNVNFYKRLTQDHRIYTKRMSLFPIPQDEVNRDPQIVQNTGWTSE
jgi:hypothetical protein